MNIGSSGQVVVTSAGVQVVAANANVPNRRAVLIKNTHATLAVYLGNNGITTATGHLLAAGESISIPANCPIYGIVASTSVTVTFLELVS